MNLTTQFHQVPRLRMRTAIDLHFPVCLHVVVLSCEMALSSLHEQLYLHLSIVNANVG